MGTQSRKARGEGSRSDVVVLWDLWAGWSLARKRNCLACVSLSAVLPALNTLQDREIRFRSNFSLRERRIALPLWTQEEAMLWHSLAGRWWYDPLLVEYAVIVVRGWCVPRLDTC